MIRTVLFAAASLSLVALCIGMAAAPEGIPRAAGPINLSERLIRDKYGYAYGIAAADFDGDGDLDVAASSWNKGNQFAWFVNPGQEGLDGEWAKHVIDSDVAETRTICAGDFNGDGKPDVVGTASSAALTAWYENSGK